LSVAYTQFFMYVCVYRSPPILPYLQFLCERLNRIYQQSLQVVEDEGPARRGKGETIAVQLGLKRPREKWEGGREGGGSEREGRGCIF